jgi:hypothetical protein
MAERCFSELGGHFEQRPREERPPFDALGRRSGQGARLEGRTTPLHPNITASPRFFHKL